MPACAAKVWTISTASWASGMAPVSRPTVNTPRTSPGAPSGRTMAGPSGMCSRAAPATRSSWPKSSRTTASPVVSTSPDTEALTGRTRPMASGAPAPAACWMTSCWRSGVGSASATRSAPDISSACCGDQGQHVIRRRPPDSSLLVTSLLARSQRCWRRASSYSLALSMATPAAAASATSSASSSSSNSAPPSFSVR